MKKQNIHSLNIIANVEVLKACQQKQVLGGKSDKQEYVIIEDHIML